MNNQIITTLGLAIVLFAGFGDRALAQGAPYRASTDARQHGYEHAYRDGADRGRQDRERGIPYSVQANDYWIGATDYERAFGNKGQYMNGYRDGYKAGYDDGYYDNGGQYGQLYGRPADDSRRPFGSNTRASRTGGFPDLPFDAGYRDGIASGGQDRDANVRSDYRGTDAYQNADFGYRASDGNRNAYQTQFRDGFERGYQDGYGRTRYATDGGGYFPLSGGTGAADTRDGQGSATRSIVVAGNRQWTTTSIRVNQGDTIRLDATGEIRFTSNAGDRAGTAGSLAQTYVSGAPLPRAFAGALIGRIDNGLPFGIGNQTSLVMPASGILYLGINDDIVGDNSGQFDVRISW